MKRIIYLLGLVTVLSSAGCVVHEHRGGAYDGYSRGYGYGYRYDRDRHWEHRHWDPEFRFRAYRY